MKNSLFITALNSLLLLSSLSYGQAKKVVTNFLSVPAPIHVQGKAYQLSWSSHPDASLYKHEYLSVGDLLPNYKSMVMIDFVVTQNPLQQVVSARIRQLDEMKKANPIVNYELMENKATGEIIIDCLLGQTAADDQNSIVERNVYRYKAVKVTSGQRGILLFAVSVRRYGKDIDPFLRNLKAEKSLLLNEVAKLPLPIITIAKPY